MPLVAKDTGGADYTPVPQGTHLAICNMVVDLGLQETTFQGERSVKHQCYIRWELPHERLEWTDQNGQKHSGPMVIGKTYTLSLSEKANLRKDLQAWRGKMFTEKELEGFDLFVLAGIGCQVTVVHAYKDGKTYANVQGLAGWPKGTPRPSATENPIIKYSVDEPHQFQDLPQWIKDRLAKAVKTNGHDEPPPPSADDYGAHDDLDDSIPF